MGRRSDMQPRQYQINAVTSIWQYFADGNEGNPIVAMPTATGKSLVLAEFIRQVSQAYPGQRIMALTHVQELIEQNIGKLLTLWPSAPTGIYSAGLKRRDTDLPILFGGIASVAKRPELFGPVDLVLIDECHLVSPKGDTMYRKFLEALKQINPALKIIGLSATPYRLKQGKLTDGGIFTDLCYDLTDRRSFKYLVDNGYLAPLVARSTPVSIDTDEIRTSAGDFVQRELQEATDQEIITEAAIQETLKQGWNRKCWLVFTTGVDHAEHVAEALNAHGIRAAFAHSKMSRHKRDRHLNALKSGELQALTNYGCLTTGVDVPRIDLIVMLRPTKSPGLHVQMLGRGTRPSPGKENCLVLDFAGNVARLGPIDDPVLPHKKGKGRGKPPVRLCEACGTYSHASARECEQCGAEFPRRVGFTGLAGQVAPMSQSDKPQVELFKVDHVLYARHQKEGRPDSIKVTYYCGLRVFKEWVCLDHGGFAGKKARDWWRRHGGPEPIPSIDAALECMDTEINVPSFIKVWVNKRFPEILNYEFKQNQRTRERRTVPEAHA